MPPYFRQRFMKIRPAKASSGASPEGSPPYSHVPDSCQFQKTSNQIKGGMPMRRSAKEIPMRLQRKLIYGLFFAGSILSVAYTASAQQSETGGTPVHLVVSVEPRHGSEAPVIGQHDVIVNQGKDRRPVTSWVPATGDHAGLE